MLTLNGGDSGDKKLNHGGTKTRGTQISCLITLVKKLCAPPCLRASVVHSRISYFR